MPQPRRCGGHGDLQDDRRPWGSCDSKGEKKKKTEAGKPREATKANERQRRTERSEIEVGFEKLHSNQLYTVSRKHKRI
eukprot:g346.t1